MSETKDTDEPVGSAVRTIDQSGTKGFSPQLAGHGKAHSSNTSSFDAKRGDTIPDYSHKPPATAGQEEGGRERLPTTSVVGRIKSDRS